MLLINLNTSTLEIFLQEHPDAIFSVSPFFLKLFFYSKKYKRIFALKSSIKDNDDIFSFLKKNAEQYSFSIKSLAQDVYRNGTDPNHSLMIERFSTEASFGMTPAEFVNKYTLALEYDSIKDLNVDEFKSLEDLENAGYSVLRLDNGRFVTDYL